jgi:hypothetical protein
MTYKLKHKKKEKGYMDDFFKGFEKAFGSPKKYPMASASLVPEEETGMIGREVKSIDKGFDVLLQKRNGKNVDTGKESEAWIKKSREALKITL